ncbi:hypothetical protein [Thermus aquaticus]|uniref:Uncharacterized protein n=1 Tax=Thermus aquaticus (strain ATCC BAA-2747 / Y51MC23) TaxID=498848 RepID=A0ABM5VQL5_THEA5|nr:hypothetical protein [Thermus aquaticus]ALJ92319.1 hypothetical protein TO73_2790 [Thermus aquaticus Y51MC23]
MVVSVLALRQAAQVKKVQSVEEALEGLRKLWKEDEGVRKLLEEAARHGYTLVQTKDVEPAFVAAVRTALAKLRERLGEKPSTLRVKYDPKRKEERSKPKPMTWESPEGVRYTVEVYDLTPREEKYWGFRDTRVEEAAKWVEQFLAASEVQEGPSVLEEALEYEDNPHFEREDLLPEDLEADLRLLGWDGTLRSLIALVESLPAREKEFKERVRSITALVDREEGKVLAVRMPNSWEIREASKDVVNAVLSLGLLTEALEKEDWRTGEVRRYVEDLKPFVPGLMASLNAIATLRRAKYLLDELGRGRRVAVYRDPSTGEPVYRTPVIG